MSLSGRAGWNPHLIDEHDGEDGLIDEPGGAASVEDRQWQVRKDICLTCV